MKLLTQLLPFYCALVSMTVFSGGCQSPSESSTAQPAAIISRKVKLEGIPSASGIERIGNKFYVIGDDSPYLFCLNKKFEIEEKVLLLNAESVVEGRIPKPVKPDLEAITSVRLDEQPYLVILGSGSTNARNNAYLVPVTSQGTGKPLMVPLQKLYEQLRSDKKVTGEAALNIEGLAADEEYFYLLQRFSPGGKNVLITYTLEAITPFLLGYSPAPKPAAIHAWDLPELAKIKTGFSGMTAALGGRILFTSSAEETPNAVLDGEVYGSMVGWLRAHPTASSQLIKPDVVVPITEKDGTAYKSKIESICISSQEHRALEAVAVADNDDGVSELIELRFNW